MPHETFALQIALDELASPSCGASDEVLSPGTSGAAEQKRSGFCETQVSHLEEEIYSATLWYVTERSRVVHYKSDAAAEAWEMSTAPTSMLLARLQHLPDTRVRYTVLARSVAFPWLDAEATGAWGGVCGVR